MHLKDKFFPHTAQRVTSNTFWQIASKATNSFSGLFIIALITRFYGETGVGIYTIALGYVSFYFVTIDFGLNAIAVKHLLDASRDTQQTIRNLLGLRLLIATIIMFTALSIATLLPYNPISNTGYAPIVKVAIALSIGAILIQAILATTNAYFQANHKYKHSFIANFTSASFNALAVALLIMLHAPLMTIFLAFTCSGIVGACVSLVLVRHQTHKIAPLFNKAYLKQLITETLPITISLMLNLVYFRIDGLLLPLYRQVEEVGHYNVAYKIFDAILVIPSYFANALYPVLLEKYNQSTHSFLVIIKKTLLTLVCIAILGTIATWILAPFMVNIILKGYDPQTILFTRILSSGQIVFFISSLAMWSLIVIGKQKILSLVYGITMVINILLNIVFIPQYGATASAVITVTTELLVLLLTGSYAFVQLKNMQR